jgi:hypothetical protein
MCLFGDGNLKPDIQVGFVAVHLRQSLVANCASTACLICASTIWFGCLAPSINSQEKKQKNLNNAMKKLLSKFPPKQ